MQLVRLNLNQNAGKYMRTLLYLVLGLTTSAVARADDKISIRGFGTVGYTQLLTSEGGEEYNPVAMGFEPRHTNKYWGIRKTGTFTRDTRFGLNIDAPLMNGTMHLTAQFYAEGANQTNGYEKYFTQRLSLLSLRGEFVNNLHVAVGLLQAPMWMISEERYVGFTFPYIRPPSEVVGITRSGDTVEGASIYYNWNVGSWTIRPRIAFGNYNNKGPYDATSSVENEANILFNVLQFEYENILISAGYHTFRGASNQDLYQMVNQAGMDMRFTLVNHLDYNGYNTVLGMKAEFEQLFLMAEYNSNTVNSYNFEGFLYPMEDSSQTLSGGYVLLGLPLGRWMPRVTVATARRTFDLDANNVEKMAETLITNNPDIPDAQKPLARQAIRAQGTDGFRKFYRTEAQQTTINLGLNYQWSPTTVLKAEFEQVKAPASGTIGEGLFGLKRGSTVSLANFAIDFIF
jgi:hypothetical protein